MLTQIFDEELLVGKTILKVHDNANVKVFIFSDNTFCVYETSRYYDDVIIEFYTSDYIKEEYSSAHYFGIISEDEYQSLKEEQKKESDKRDADQEYYQFLKLKAKYEKHSQ